MENPRERAWMAAHDDDIGIERKKRTGPSGGRRPRGSGEAKSFREYKFFFFDVMSYASETSEEEGKRGYP